MTQNGLFEKIWPTDLELLLPTFMYSIVYIK